MLFYIIIFGILFCLMVLGFISYMLFKLFLKIITIPNDLRIKIDNKSLTSETIRDGVKSALQELKYEEYQEKLMVKKYSRPESVYSSSDMNEKPVKYSGGNLVPYGLTDEEKVTLEMFYRND